MKRVLGLTLMAFTLVSCGQNPTQVEMREGSETDFALNFTRTVFNQADAGNICVSPYSAGVALSMLSEGSAGQTKSEFEKVLNFCEFGKKALPEVDGVIVKSANSLWIDSGFAVKPSYADALKSDFGALASSLDFASTSAVKAINTWCSEQTAGRIPEIVKELNPRTPLIVANALYFKAAWKNQFDKAFTRKRIFHGTNGDSEVDFMSQTKYFKYASHDGSVIIQLPYEGNRYAMTFIMPSESLSLEGLEPYFNEEYLSKALSYMQDTRVRLSLPKFKMEYDINLNAALEDLGLQSAYSSEADFSLMTDSPVALSSVIQKTFLEVNESGSEAAAVTMGMVALTSAPVHPPVEVVLDRPFCFMISDLTDGTILFTGRIENQ